ncbi:pyridoxal-phosphate dependent enzyme [Sorangium sp. So ce448]
MKTILDAIGETPLLTFDGVHVKCEYLNPSGSVKDRLARYIIEKAEKAGLLGKGGAIVEASSGNTGTAVAMVCFVGVSSGANLLAARRVKEKSPELRNVVTVFPDEGEKYLSESWFSR